MKILAIDFETANYPRESAIALGLSVIEDGEVTETRAWTFRPPGNRVYIRPDFIDIHGITPAMLRDRPHFDGVWDEMQPYFLRAETLVAHNAGFDRSVLYAVAAHYDIELPPYFWKCTVNLSRVSWPGLHNHKLPTVAEHLGIALNHHDAASDAEACARIFIEATRASAAADAA
jgi:DNA polymerase-3 subunit epsilon